VQVICNILLESSRKRLQFCFKFHLNQRFSLKVMVPQSHESSNFENFGTPTQEYWTKCQLDVGPVANHIVYSIKGKVVASPKFRPWWVLWVRVCTWLFLAPKVFQPCTNQLVVWFMQVYVNDWLLVILPSPIPELQHAPPPPKVLRAKECAPTFYFFVVFNLDSHWSLSKSLVSHHQMWIKHNNGDAV
jgi:hypothetical protein